MQPGHWGRITIHYRLIWDCVPFFFFASYDSQGLRWRYSNPTPHGVEVWWLFGMVILPFMFRKQGVIGRYIIFVLNKILFATIFWGQSIATVVLECFFYHYYIPTGVHSTSLSTIEELLRRKGSGSGLERREYGRRDPSRWPRGTLYPLQLALTSPTSGGLSESIARSPTQTTEFEFAYIPTVRKTFEKHSCDWLTPKRL
jgi:hypothetical protein